MIDIKPGQAYKAHRNEIVNPKPKYHLYLADDIVFLINSLPNHHEFNIPLNENDCSILTKDCFLQLNNIYRYDKNCPTIKVADMSPRVLTALLNYLKDKTITKVIPKIYVDRAIGILISCLDEKKLS